MNGSIGNNTGIGDCLEPYGEDIINKYGEILLDFSLANVLNKNLYLLVLTLKY